MVDVSICICTYKRPLLLQKLLRAIFDQTQLTASFQIIVVDNDPAQSASSILNEMQNVFSERLFAISLTEPNISLARNAAIQAATGTWIAMVDDDEYPESGWLSELMQAQMRFNADVVFAPVLPEFETGVPGWIKKGGYFDRRRFLSGTLIDHKNARSGNVLVRRSLLFSDWKDRKEGEMPFDPDFGRTGGEDSLLFRKLASVGARMVWCDEAPVYELVPCERATAKWLLSRSYRTGLLFMRTELSMFYGSKRSMRAAWLSLRALLQLGVALLLAIVCVIRPTKAFTWLRTAASQLGKIAYFLEKNMLAYGETVGHTSIKEKT